MYYIAQTVFTPNDFNHHGIKGQKWNVQNGPPYPLGKEQLSTQEKRGVQSKTHKLTKKQKAIITGVAVGCLAAGIGYIAYKNKLKINDIMLKHPNDMPSQKFNALMYSKNPSREKNHCNQNAIAAAFELGGKLHVHTKPGVFNKDSQKIYEEIFKNTNGKSAEIVHGFTSKEQADRIITRLMKDSEQGYGMLSSINRNSKIGDGHAISWLYDKGKVYYFDSYARTPNGAISVPDASYYFDSFYNNSNKLAFIGRLDNVEINYDAFYKYFEDD